MEEVPNKSQSPHPGRMPKDERVLDPQPSRSPWGFRVPAGMKTSSFLTITIVAMLVFVASAALIHVIVQMLTLPVVLHPHQALNLKAKQEATLTMSDRVVHGTRGYHDRGQPWKDPKWVSKVQQSGTPTKAGGFTVLVTGAAGFVGSYASMAIEKKGWGVVGLDNFNNYYDPALKRQREAHVYKKARIFIVNGDINDKTLLKELLRIVPFTHVLHLAAQTGQGFRLRYVHAARSANARSYVHSNVAGLVAVLEACGKATSSNLNTEQQMQQPAIVWASSSSVYGLNTRVPFSEFDRTDHPASLYAATKKAGEEIVHVYNHLYGLSITVLRLFEVYGAWSRPDMDVLKITRAILEEKPIALYADEAHDLSYIDDIISGCIAAVETADRSVGFGPDSEAGKKGQRAQLRLFNLGTGVLTRTTDIISILENLLEKKATRVIQLRDLSKHAVRYIPAVANLSLAQTHLGYAPHTHLPDGLKKFVAWYQHRYAKFRTI